jgi:hypothetical protein
MLVLLMGVFSMGIAGVSAWIAWGIEWTAGVIVRPASLRELLCLTAYWAVTAAVASAMAQYW